MNGCSGWLSTADSMAVVKLAFTVCNHEDLEEAAKCMTSWQMFLDIVFCTFLHLATCMPQFLGLAMAILFGTRIKVLHFGKVS